MGCGEEVSLKGGFVMMYRSNGTFDRYVLHAGGISLRAVLVGMGCFV